MLETKEQKQIFTAAIVLIILLGVISSRHKTTFKPEDNSFKNKQKQASYQVYLDSLKIDPLASKELFKKVVSEQEVQKQVEADLEVNQKVVMPVIQDSQIKIAETKSPNEVVSYFKKNAVLTEGFKAISEPLISQVFGPEANSEAVISATEKIDSLISQYYKIPVPKEAINFHKANLNAFEAYKDLLKTSKNYGANSASNPWPKVYRDYLVMNDTVKVMDKEYEQLDQKYSITESLTKVATDSAKGSFLIPKAQAFVIVIDVKAIVRDILQETLATAFAKFAVTFLDKFITLVESNYKIANFLYYTDALVSGQYVDDYLDKYVKSTLDKAMIKNFIPQLNCGTPQDLQKVFKAKADQYLGFDPATVNPSDPQYYSKMAKVGSFLASPSGWELYYQDAASTALSEAEKAADRELTSQGLKNPRDVQAGGSIVSSITSIAGSLKAAYQAQLDLGNSNSRSFVGKIVNGLTQNFFNNFVFKGAVFKEQNVCITAPQIKPVIPVSGVVQDPITPPPSELDIERQYQPRGANGQ